jgi:hypothetical protein
MDVRLIAIAVSACETGGCVLSTPGDYVISTSIQIAHGTDLPARFVAKPAELRARLSPVARGRSG